MTSPKFSLILQQTSPPVKDSNTGSVSALRDQPLALDNIAPSVPRQSEKQAFSQNSLENGRFYEKDPSGKQNENNNTEKV